MISRYDRQIPLVGEVGMDRIRNSTVGIIGCGGLGTHVATSLASAGIGKIVIVDGDIPDTTNLNRQFVYREGQSDYKADVLRDWLMSVNPDVSAESYPVRFSPENAVMLSSCDVLVDCLDNMESRMDLNSYAVMCRKPLVHGGISGMVGQVTVVMPGSTPCLKCIFNGVNSVRSPSISSAVALIASIQANEVIKLVTGVGELLSGKILTVDLFDNSFEVSEVGRRSSCEVCGHL